VSKGLVLYIPAGVRGLDNSACSQHTQVRHGLTHASTPGPVSVEIFLQCMRRPTLQCKNSFRKINKETGKRSVTFVISRTNTTHNTTVKRGRLTGQGFALFIVTLQTLKRRIAVNPYKIYQKCKSNEC